MNITDLKSIDGVTIIYDGECPFCARYVDLYRFKSRVNQVNLIDARTHLHLLPELVKKGHNLNDGMVVYWGGQAYYAADAMRLLSELGADSGAFNRANSTAFGHPGIAKIVYPVLVAFRKILLWVVGRKGLQ